VEELQPELEVMELTLLEVVVEEELPLAEVLVVPE
jgi:hypothetical protein